MNWRTLGVFAFLLVGTGCHRKVSVVAPPSSPPSAPPAAAPVMSVALREADSAFEGGEFARAARGYESYLQTNPKVADLDRIEFQFGVAQSMSGVSAREAASDEVFIRLINEFPQSAYVPPARRFLALRADINRLDADIVRVKANAAQLQADQNGREDKIKQLTEELSRAHAETVQRQADIARLQADQRTRDDKIKQLTDELEKLKKIDLDRRRTP